MAATYHGTITTFDSSQEDWVDYAERLEHYFVANSIDNADVQRAILFTNVGPSTYRLIKTLSLPRKPTDYSFQELVTKVQSHFHPKPSPIIKRFEFNTRVQQEGESVGVFVAALRNIAEYCLYPESILHDMLRDRIVCGIRDKAVQRTLLKESKLTYDTALDTALAAEAATNDSKQLHHNPYSTLPVNHVKGKSKSLKQKEGTSTAICYRCGGKHIASQCRFRDYECHYCKKKGHLASVCRKKKAKDKGDTDSSKDQAQTNVVGSEEESEDYSLFKVTGNASNKPLLASVLVNGVSVEMEIDTGASVSLMGEDTYRLVQDPEKPLQRSTAKLHTYTGEPIKVLGSTEVLVQHNSQSMTLPLIVMKGKGSPLLGRNWLSMLKLDWQNVFKVETNRSLQDVLTCFGEVFNEGLGKAEGVQAKIFVHPQSTPIFHKARPVPYALKAKVEAELDRLQEHGIIEPVRFADWAAPIVPVLKRDGSIRICGDYKVTANRVARLDKYPLPRIEDLFASLSGGTCFSKLDLSHAYQQIELEKESLAGSTEEEHLARLSEVLKRLAESGMRLKQEKCSFLLSSVEYLGHTISREGLKTSESKVKAISNAPAPSNVSELRSFIGLVNYYGKFLPDLATTLTPLYELLHAKKKWSWGKEQEKSFREIKELLKSSRVLTHFDDTLPLTL